MSTPRHRPGPWRRRRRALVGLALAGVVMTAAACGSPPTPCSGPATSTPTSTSGATSTSVAPADECGVLPGPGVTITSPSEPCAVTTRVGTTVRVSLPAGFNWGDPHSDSAAVTIGNIARPAGGGLTATLIAAAPGRATVRATGTVACAPGQACPQLARLWALQVTVS